MKTAVMIISRLFPAGHPRQGKPTGLMDKFLKGTKIYTIRDGISFWEGIARRVNAGEMFISVRMWIGKPRQSPQQEMRRITKVGAQRIEMDYTGGVLTVRIDDREWADHEALAAGDGLSLPDFTGWFFSGKKSRYEGVIVHFTDFRF